MEAAATLSDRAAHNLSSTLTGSFAHSSSDGKAIVSVLARYNSHGRPMTPNFVDDLDTCIVRDIAVGIACQTKIAPLVGWGKLRSGSIKSTASLDASSDSSSKPLSNFAQSKLDEAIRSLQQRHSVYVNGTPDMEDEGKGRYDVGIASKSLEIMTASAAAAAASVSGLIALLEFILSDQSPTMESELHITALQCVNVVVHR